MIVDQRVSQLTAKDFRQEIRRLQQEDRQIRAAQARSEGRRLDLEPSEQEQEVLDRQQHIYTSDWSETERERFKQQQDQLWATIPEEFRARAERLARGGF